MPPLPPRELRIGLGVALEHRLQKIQLKTEWTWRNFLGGMRTLSIRVQPAFVALPSAWEPERVGPALDSEVKLTQPAIFGTEILAFGIIGYDLGIREAYQYQGILLRPGIERNFWKDRIKIGISYNFRLLSFFATRIDQNTDDYLFQVEGQLGVGFKDRYRLAWFEEYVQLDLRNSIIDPRAGFYLETRFEQGHPYWGSNYTYLKITPDLRGYIPLGTTRVVLALRGMLGHIEPLRGDESPTTQRYFFGGPTSHRGFSYGRLAPFARLTEQDVGVPIGGNNALLLSSELRINVFRLAGNWFGINPFFDAGDVVSTFSRLNLSRLHLAAGASLQYITPIGALRFGVGVRLNRLGVRTDDGQLNPDPGDRLTFHLMIGEAF
jgi:outer membrane protein assembly factor BamA